MRRRVMAASICAAMLVSCSAFADEPVVNINPKWQPNLAAAQELCYTAYEKIERAQRNNEYDMDGHAERAKALLDQVNMELKMAAESANRHRRR